MLALGALSLPARASPADPLSDLQRQYNPALYAGLSRMLGPHHPHVVGDSTASGAMEWTKATNIGIDLLATLVAEDRGLLPAARAREHVRAVVAALGALRTYHGLFPEVIMLSRGTIRAQSKAGVVRYSALDSAWVTLALSLVCARYAALDAPLARAAGALIAAQDYGVVRAADGKLGSAVEIDDNGELVKGIEFTYYERNSEARALVLALVGLGKLDAAAFTGMEARATEREGVRIAAGFHLSAFVELASALFFDEMALAPRSLGRDHRAYLEATVRVARRAGHRVFGYAPACTPQDGYAEYGLDRPDIVSPYAAALLALTGDARAVANLARVLHGLAPTHAPVPDGLDPRTGMPGCAVARTLDQGLLFLALNAASLRQLARAARWYASAERSLRALDAAPLEAGAQPVIAGAVTAPERDRELARGALVLGRLLHGLMRVAEATGGQIDRARGAEAEASATATERWLELLPDNALLARRESAGSSSGLDPIWRLEAQSRVVLSLEKLMAGVAANREQARVRVELALREHEVLTGGLRGYLELHLQERRITLLAEQRDALQPLIAGLERDGRPAAGLERLQLQARAAALGRELSALQAAHDVQAARLSAASGVPIGDSGLPPQLGLDKLLQLVASAARARPIEPLQLADLDHQRALLRVIESRAWYAPELHAGVFAAIPLSGNQHEREFERIAGELALVFKIRPADRERRSARRAAVERSRLLLAQIRAERRAARAQAEVRLESRVSIWAIDEGRSAARAEYEDVSARFRRGERSAIQVVEASQQATESENTRALAFEQAVAAQLALVLDAPDTGEAGESAAELDPEPAQVAHFPGREDRGPPPSLGLRAAEADVERALSQAAAERREHTLAFTLGVLRPLYRAEGAGAARSAQPPVGPMAFYPEAVTESTLLGRVSADVPFNGAAQRAAASEAQLRKAQWELARRTLHFDWLRARIGVDHATALAQRADQALSAATERFQSVQRMREAALVGDDALRLSAIELAAARAQRERDAAGLREANLQLASVERGAQLSASPSAPLPIERWQGAGFARPQQSEGELRTRIARLQLQLAYHQLEVARGPAPAMNWSMQVTRGLRTHALSASLALGFELDPVGKPAQRLDAAQALGRARAELSELERANVEQQRNATLELESAQRQHVLAEQCLHRLRASYAELESAQAARPDLHASVKWRERSALEATLAAADRQRIEASARLSLARLRGGELGLPDPPTTDDASKASTAWSRADSASGPSSSPARSATYAVRSVGPQPPEASSAPQPPDLRVALERIAALEPDARVAGLAARAVEDEWLPAPGLRGFHLSGPTLTVTRDGPHALRSAESRDSPQQLRIAAGVKLALDEALSGFATAAQRRAATLGARGATQRAQLWALHEIGGLWAARELERWAQRRERDELGRLNTAQVRFEIGQVDIAALAGLQARHAQARLALEDASREREQIHGRLLGLGIDVGERALDDYGALAPQQQTARMVALLAPIGDAELKRSDELAQLAAERSAERAQTFASATGVLGPARAGIELRPFSEDPTHVLDRLEFEGKRALHWEAQFRLPIHLQALGETLRSAARARNRDGELRALERHLREQLVERRSALGSAATLESAAGHSARTATVAFELTRERFFAGDPAASLESVAFMQDRALAEQRAHAQARAALIEQVAQLRTLAERYGLTRPSGQLLTPSAPPFAPR